MQTRSFGVLVGNKRFLWHNNGSNNNFRGNVSITLFSETSNLSNGTGPFPNRLPAVLPEAVLDGTSAWAPGEAGLEHGKNALIGMLHVYSMYTPLTSINIRIQKLLI